MVNISIDVTDLGGEARPGDKVVFWRPRMGGSATHAGRVISTAPVTVFLTDGKATVSDVEPGEMTVLLQCRGVESQGPVTVGVPDGDHAVTLRALLESQFEYAPPIVSAVQEAASNASASEEAAIQAQIRSEAAADRADAKVDDAINNGANLVRDEVKQDADRAVSARQAAAQSESKAKASENAAATSESNAKTSETNAKQSETNAGDYAAVATTAATEAVDAMGSVSDIIGANYATQEYVDSKTWVKRDFVSGEDLNEVTDPGLYTMPSYARANTLLNKPTAPNAVDRGATEVLAGGGAVQQTWYPMGVASRTHMPVMRRRRDNGGTWTEWEQINAKVDVPDYDPLEAVGMTATGASGELTGLRSVLRDLNPGAAPVWSWWAPAPTDELEMPTHDGGGQTCHPSVLYFPSGWNGWKYWMAHTPYPNFKEAHEDPNIAVSNDGTTWQVPEGLTNPLDDGLGRPNYHNSDAHLVMSGNTMVVTWRTVDRPNGGQNIIYARTSTDGVNWTDKTEVLKVPLGNAESTFVAQSLIKMPTGWRLYGIRSMYGPNRLGYYETSVETLPTTSDWGAAKDCDLGEIPTGRDPWHSEVQRLSANDWVAVISDGRYGSTGVDGDIYLATSTDGIKWDVSPLPLTPRANGVINSLYKTGFVASGTGSDRKFDLWVSGYRTDTRTWGIYRTLAEYRGSKQAETLPVTTVGTGSPEGKVAAPVGSIYTDTAATNGSIRWIKASGTGNTGWRDDYGDTTAALEEKADKSALDLKADKTYVDENKFNRGNIPAPSAGGDANLLDLLGAYNFTNASIPNTPTGIGTILNLPIGSAKTQLFVNWNTPALYIRRQSTSGSWTDWVKFASMSDLANLATKSELANFATKDELAAIGGSSPRSVSGTKIVPLSITAPGTTKLEPAASGAVRWVRKWAHMPKRVRVHISNWHPANNQGGGGNIAIYGRLGPADEQGNFRRSSLIFSSKVIPGDKTELVSPWVTVGANEGEHLGLSIGWSGMSGDMYMMQGGGWRKDAISGWGDLTRDETWEWAQETPFYVWIEAEVPTTAPVVMVNGDSISIGTASSNPVTDGWASVYAREQNALPVLFSQHGSSMTSWVTTGNRWKNLYPGIEVQPDAIITALGQNDLGAAGMNLETLQTRYEAVRQSYVDRWPDVPVHIAGVTPSTKSSAVEVIRRDFNTWLATYPFGERGYFDFSEAVGSADDEALAPEYSADGLHPNTAGQKVLGELVASHPVTPYVATEQQLKTLKAVGEHEQ